MVPARSVFYGVEEEEEVLGFPQLLLSAVSVDSMQCMQTENSSRASFSLFATQLRLALLDDLPLPHHALRPTGDGGGNDSDEAVQEAG